jgi:hypothetical protein
MKYFKGVLIGFGTVLLGSLITALAWIIWASWKAQSGPATVSFSPAGLSDHLAHSLGFWIILIALFVAGFVPSVLSSKR